MIGHQLFAPHLAYIPVQRYLINHSENLRLDNEDEQIYGEIYTADWWWITQQLLINSGVHNATIILMLLSTNKTVFTKYIRDMCAMAYLFDN